MSIKTLFRVGYSLLLFLLISGMASIVTTGFDNPGKQICGVVIPLILLLATTLPFVLREEREFFKDFLCQKGTKIWLIAAVLLGLTTFFN